MDHAAATPMKQEVKKAMEPFWSVNFGNAGAIHQEGTVAKKALEQSREKIARLINARPDEIIFNSGGTEANNLAIWGVLNKLNDNACLSDSQGIKFKDMHLITTVMEHSSVLQCFKFFEKKGAQVDYLDISSEGIIDLKQFKKLLKPNTVLVSIMFVNNEIGTIQPMLEIAKIIRGFRKKQSSALPIFHTDAAQALLYLPINTQKLGVDLMSFDAQKIYGPKGAGILYIKKGIEINPFIMGGKQERGLRPGTENIPLIVGFAKALELAVGEKGKEMARLTKLRNYFIEAVLEKIPGTKLNGGLENRLPNNANIFFPKINNEFAVIQLDARGIACSTNSACLDGGFSYVVNSLGKKNGENARGSIRFSFGRQTAKKDLDYVIKCLLEICDRNNF